MLGRKLFKNISHEQNLKILNDNQISRNDRLVGDDRIFPPVFKNSDTYKVKRFIKMDKKHCLQRAVWRNGGSNPHEKEVQI